MKEALIVSHRKNTKFGKNLSGAFNNTESPTMGGHAIREAVKRAGIEPEEVDDVFHGGVLGATGHLWIQYRENCGHCRRFADHCFRNEIDRQCSSGMRAIATRQNKYP
ncbi:MAG: hypothetical protein CM1200mP30_04580 [Pseudomonadota bacterium]|nr:MAG: hypothetical protein CM1200mP30_04580 [Pseudomonadota bacterium]